MSNDSLVKKAKLVSESNLALSGTIERIAGFLEKELQRSYRQYEVNYHPQPDGSILLHLPEENVDVIIKPTPEGAH